MFLTFVYDVRELGKLGVLEILHEPLLLLFLNMLKDGLKFSCRNTWFSP